MTTLPHRDGPAHPSLVPASPNGFVRSFSETAGKVWLLYGDDSVFRLSHRIAAHILNIGSPMVLVDGANRFDIHSIVRFAREHGADPDAFLNRLFIARGFTCYQVEATITERLPAFLERCGAQSAMIFGLLDTFYDEQASLRDVRAILARVTTTLHAMRDAGMSLLLSGTDWRVLPPERNELLSRLKASMDRVYRLDLDENQRPQLFRERGGIATPHSLTQGARSDGKNRPYIHQHHRR